MKARHNPFSTDRVLQVRYRFQNGETHDSILARLDAMQFRGAIVGPQGSGKTTLQEDLASRLQSQGHPIRWCRLRGSGRPAWHQLRAEVVRHLEATHIICLDGAEKLGPLLWKRFERSTRHAGGLIVTLHRPARVPTLIECSTSPQLLREIVGELLGDNQLLTMRSCEQIFERCAGNLRDVLRELYDLCAANEFNSLEACSSAGHLESSQLPVGRSEES